MVGCGLLLYLFHTSLLSAAGRALVEDNGAQQADCILVLGGDEYGNRIVKAAELIREGYAPYALVDGPRLLVSHESDATIQFAVQNGFPASYFRAVWLPKGVDSTSTEVLYVANSVLKPNHIRKILLVTSNYHTRRAAHFMRKQVPWLQIVAVPASDPYFGPDNWWKSRNGKKIFLLEWTKTITEWWSV